ncbi:MAG: T9SS type A sorting domain-containing protein [Saprospiraceae bacterium]|nr:T9SS type A sorting domain-containing protein [Saprospiraceae bacterium]
MIKNVWFVIFILTSWITNAQKITIQFSSSPTSTPSVSVAKLRYDKPFAYSFTFDDATDDAYKLALPLFKSGWLSQINQYASGYFYTDGCGNDIPFRAGIAWNSVNRFGEDTHLNNNSGELTWTQLDSLYKADWDIMNHSYAHRARWEGTMTEADYDFQINQNRIAVRQKTEKSIEMPLFVVPSGDFMYQDRAFIAGHKAVFDQNFPNGGVSYEGVEVGNVPNLNNFKMFRWDLQQIITGLLPSKVHNIAATAQGNNQAIWWTEFSHRIDYFTDTTSFNYYKFKDYMTNLAQKYGKDGTDKMWFAPLQTVFEYLQMRQHVQFTSRIVNNTQLEIDFDLSSVPTWLRRKTLTLVINSDVNFNNVSTPLGVTTSFKGIGTRKIINLDFTGSASVVPVELVNFSAKQGENGTIQLNWQTASEINFKQFEVEKSSNGKDFINIGIVKAKGYTGVSQYVFTDLNFKEKAYYRLHQIDNDGKTAYSKTIAVAPNSVRPNVKITPSVSDEIWTVETDAEDLRRAQIEVFDAHGKLMISQKGTEKNIKTHRLVRGVYFVKVTIGGQFWVRKMVKWE